MSDEAEKLPISSHLEELRKTLLWSLVGLIAGVVPLFSLSIQS